MKVIAGCLGVVLGLATIGANAAFDDRQLKLDEPKWPELKSELHVGEDFKPRGHEMNKGVPFPGEEFKEAITTSVEVVNGTPTFMLNGKPFFAMWGSIPAHARTVAKMGHAQWGDRDINLFTVNDYHHYDWWLGEEKYNLKWLDWIAEFQGRDNPGAYFIWDLDVYPPTDWGEKHPDDLCRDDKGDLVNSAPGKNSCSYSFASKAARETMKKAITAVIEYIEASPYANRVFGYRINSGTTIEWLGWQPKAGRVTDFSPVMQKAFAEFCAARGQEEAGKEIPSKESRFFGENGQILVDPYKHIRQVLWNDHYSRMDMETLAELCEHAKKVLKGRKVVGTYYGYTMTLHDGMGSQYRSHYALKPLLERKSVDFLCSPQAYRARRLGGPNTDMKPFKSLQDRGILSVIEDDSRTHNIWKWDAGTLQTITAEQSRQMLRRNTAIDLCRNEPVYFYSICGGGEFNFPEYHQDAFKARAAGELALKNGARRMAEVAIVSSENAIKMMPLNRRTYERTMDLIQSYEANGKVTTRASAGAVFGHSTFAANYEKWTRGGAPIDYLLAEDLANAKTDYKLYIFINAFMGDRKLIEAAEKLRERNCTILWVYAPGWAGGGKVGAEPMKRLTGLDFKEIEGGGLPVAKMKDGRIVGAYVFTETDTEPREVVSQKVTPLYSAEGDEVLGRYENGEPAIVVKKTGAATTIFSGPWTWDMEFIEDIYKRAGVHVYSDKRDPIEANNVMFTIHARTAGKKRIKLPRKASVIVDVYNKKIVAENTDSFTVEMKLHETNLYYFGPNAVELLEVAPSQAYAKEEFSKYVKQITGRDYDGEVEIALDKTLGADEFAVSKQGGKLTIRGGKRGVLYGVYDVLEKFGGVRFLTSWCETVPKAEKFVVPDGTAYQEKPAFLSRLPYWMDVLQHPDFAAKLRVNGHLTKPLGARHGGAVYQLDKKYGFSHTFNFLVPPAEFKDSHPEYFSEIDGKRVTENTQLCLTNPEVFDIVVKRIKQAKRENPEANLFAIAHNDYKNWCECAKCKAINDAADNPGMTEFLFVNKVVEEVTKEYPDIIFKLSAYVYTRKPPKEGTFKCHPNVMIDLCPIECDLVYPLPESKFKDSVSFCKDMEGWAKVRGENFMIWDYNTLFLSAPIILPNAYTPQANNKYYLKNGVNMIFNQGLYLGYHAELAELKAYLQAKWAWNPELPAETLIAEFCEGYYGPAAPYIREFYKEVYAREREFCKDGSHAMTCYAPTKELAMDSDFFKRAAKLWEQAKEEVKGDSRYDYNVRMSAFAFDYTSLCMNAKRYFLTQNPEKYGPETDAYELAKRCVEAIDEGQKARKGLVRLVEDINRHRMQYGELEEIYKSGPVDKAVKSSLIIEAKDFTRSRASSITNGVVQFNLKHYDWVTVLRLGNLAYDEGRKYKLRMHVKVERDHDMPDGIAFKGGFYDKDRNINIDKSFKASEAASDWQWYDVGETDFSSTAKFWVSSGKFDQKQFKVNPCVKAVYIDKVEIVAL